MDVQGKGDEMVRSVVGEKTVSRLEALACIREYVERMLNYFKTKRGTSGDDQIDCPACGRYRGLMFRTHAFPRYKVWLCANFRCNYELPPDLSPPSPKELERLFQEMEWEKKKKKAADLFEALGVNIEI